MTLCLLGLTTAVRARADQIVVNGTTYPGARIVGLEEGRLRFRSADGKLRTAPVDEIELMIVDRGGMFADFNQAERFYAGGQPERAAIRYRRALRLSEEFWPDLIAARSVLACDAAGQLDKAAANFIRVVRGRWAGPAAAARLIPKTIPPKRDGRVVRAIERLDAALLKNPDRPQRVLLELLRYEILRRTRNERAASVGGAIATLSIPAVARSKRVYSIQLEALQAALKDDVTEVALTGLDSAIRHCPETLLPSFLLLKGRTLSRTALTRDQNIRAAWPFMRVAIHFPDDQRAAEGLYGAALALERSGRADKAMELLEECLRHKRLATETRRSAEAALTRLQAEKGKADATSYRAPNAGAGCFTRRSRFGLGSSCSWRTRSRTAA